MAKRRSPGEGSIFQDKNGRWSAILDLGRRPDGRRHRVLRRARTRADAQRKLREMREVYEDLGQAGFAGRTVAAMLDDFAIVRAAESPSRKVRERDELADDLIREFFGSNTKIQDVSVGQCDVFLAGLVDGSLARSGQPISRDYARRFRSYLQRAFVNEIRQGHLRQNPAQFAVIPASTVGTRSMRALSRTEWRRVYDVATDVTKLAIDLGARHGLRPQEVRSTRWSDIKLSSRRLTVSTQFDSDDEFSPTKTAKATRTIHLHDETLGLLEARRSAQAEHRQDAAERWVERGLVLTTRWGTAISQSNHRRSLHNACVAAGVEPITPYELRHTAITHQIDEGHSATRVADWAGTSERMIHRHYRHRLHEVAELSPLDY